MATASGIDFVAELQRLREWYVSATPRQRLGVIRQRLEDHHFGPNRLVTAVSAVEAMARSLVMNHHAATKADLLSSYPRFRYRKPETLVREFLSAKGISDPKEFFGESDWRFFGYAVDYRNLLAHECTYLALEKFAPLIAACDAILDKLAKLGRVRERRT